GAMGGMAIGRRRDRMLAALQASGRLPSTLALTPFRGHAYTVRRHQPRRIAGERFLLVGDGAGLARDISGEGIGPAVRSAGLAAEAILSGTPASYAERLAAVYGRPSALLGALVEMLPTPLLHAIARLACTRSWPRRALVLEGAFGMGGAARRPARSTQASISLTPAKPGRRRMVSSIFRAAARPSGPPRR